MEDFKVRLIAEYKQLDERIEKLVKFLMTNKFYELPEQEQTLLLLQQNAMVQYAIILESRAQLMGITEYELGIAEQDLESN